LHRQSVAEKQKESENIQIRFTEKQKAKERSKKMAGGGGAVGEEELEEFYVRYYVGHKGKFGHEFLEFEFRSNGMLRYANNSNYKNDTMIRKQVYVTPAVLKECRRIILESEVSSLIFTFLHFDFLFCF
jgi:hypothetical protein